MPTTSGAGSASIAIQSAIGLTAAAGSSTPSKVITINEGTTVTYVTSLDGGVPEVPAAPTNLVVTPGSGSLAVSWTAPPQPSRSQLSDYAVQWSADNGTTWNTVSDGTSLTPSATITGLTPGVPHLVRVAAINEYGAGAPVVTTSPVTPQATSPAAPAAPTVTAGDRQVTLSWTAPADNGSAITGYSIEYSVDGGASHVTVNPWPATATSATETGLVNGTSYIFRVVARNAVGAGTASPWSAQATPSNAVPAAPTGLSATPTSGGASLAWTGPAAAADPAAAITDYFVEVTADGGATWTAYPRPASTTTTASLTDLEFGTSYLFRVSAVNQFGRGLPSAISAATSPLATAPAAPGDVSATAATDGVTLTWAPSAGNGSPVTDYLIQSSSDGGVTWTSFLKPVSTATTTIVTGLVAGRTYVFQVRGVNGVGSGPWSDATQPVVTTTSVPAVVTDLAATPQSGGVALSWIAPANNGGVAITDYVIDISKDGSTWWRYADGTNTMSSATVAGLPGGDAFFFRVAARNPLGEGPAATTSDAVTTLATVPAAPQRPMVTAGNGQVALEWLMSPPDNGSAITGYVIEYSPADESTAITSISTGSTATSATVAGLTNGTSYVFRVSAMNSVGTGAASAWSQPVTVVGSTSVPPAPSGLTATPISGGATLDWTSPDTTGIEPVTDYAVFSSVDGGTTWTPAARVPSTNPSATVTGLSFGVSYLFRVSAVNVFGAGEPAASTSAIQPLAAAPAAPSNLTAVPGNGLVTLAWTAPATNGTPVTDYLVLVSSDGGATYEKPVFPPSTQPTRTITGLTNGLAYSFTVIARSDAGDSVSDWSTPVTPFTTVTVATPAAPTGLTATPQPGGVDLSWTAPTDTGGWPITDYVIEWSFDGGQSWYRYDEGTSGDTTARLAGIGSGTRLFRVAAATTRGIGAFATIQQTVPPQAVPDRPFGVRAMPGTSNGEVFVSWLSSVPSGAGAVTDFLIDVSVDNGGSWTRYDDGVSMRTDAALYLTAGTSYVIRVTAQNAAGTGQTSFQSGSVTAPSSISTMRMVTVGDAGNADMFPWKSGSVEYEYRIGTYEVTNAEYVAFLNTVDPSGNNLRNLYSPLMAADPRGGISFNSSNSAGLKYTTRPQMADKPVVYVSWVDGVRMANWLHNGGTAGASTESGAYTVATGSVSSASRSANVNTYVTAAAHGLKVGDLVSISGLGGTGFTIEAALVTSIPTATSFSVSSTNPDGVASGTGSFLGATTAPAATAVFRIPSDHEWFKAAYYKGGSTNAGYWMHATQSDTAPTPVTATATGAGVSNFTANTANFGFAADWNGQDGNVTTVGSNGRASAYGTFDMVGNVREWTDIPESSKSMRGGDWQNLASAYSSSGSPFVREMNYTGFRLVSSITPSSAIGSTLMSNPAIMSATATTNGIRISWVPPAATGVTPTGYVVQSSTDGGARWTTLTAALPVSASSYEATGLSAGNSYAFRVAALSGMGTGSFSLASDPVFIVDTSPAAQLGAPTGLNVSPISGGAALSWTAPTTTGGSPITDYVISYSADGGTSWIRYADASSTETRATVTGLAFGTSYRFRVAAASAFGVGPVVESTAGVSPAAFAPSAPRGLVVTPGVTAASLSWTAPASTNGSAVTDFTVQHSTDGGATWTTVSRPASTATSATVSGVATGVGTLFRVRAVNAAGAGEWAATSTPMFMVAAVPGSPTGLTASVAANAPGGTASLSWTAPTSDGGALIVRYVIDFSTDDGATWIRSAGYGWADDGEGDSAPPTAGVVAGLAPGVPHRFRVAAATAYGVSEFSTASAAVTPNATAPAAPSAPMVTAGNGQVMLSWNAPASNGSAITDYVIEYSSAADGASPMTFNRATTWATVTGLSNGTSYVFRIAAKNAAGTGSASAWSAPATPSAAVPEAPTAVAATAANGGVNLTWIPPAAPPDASDAVADYLVEFSTDGGTTWTGYSRPASVIPSASLTELTFGTSYQFRVSAVNRFGISQPSAVSVATSPLATAPSAPTLLSATAGNGSVELTWTAPAANGSAIYHYGVQSSNDGGATWATFVKPLNPLNPTPIFSTATTISVTGLANGTSTIFRVAAVNAVGSGPWSTATQPVVPAATVPAAITGLTATQQNGTVTLSWTAPADSGGVTITDYLVDVSVDRSTWTRLIDGTSAATTATFTGVPGGASYYFRVAARNSLGAGPAVEQTSPLTMPATAPAAPAAPTGVTGDGKVTLTWAAPAANGSPITEYVIEYSATGGTSPVTFTRAASTETSATITGLTNGSSYVFRIAAKNAVGTGAMSAWSTQVTAAKTVQVLLDPEGNGSTLTLASTDFAAKPYMFAPRRMSGDGVVSEPETVIADGERSWTFTSTARPLGMTFFDSTAVRVMFVAPTFNADPQAEQDAIEGIATPLDLGSFTGPELDGVTSDGLEWRVDVRWWPSAEVQPAIPMAANSRSFTAPRGTITLPAGVEPITFPADGLYTVAVELIDNDGQKAERRFEVNVGQGAPMATIRQIIDSGTTDPLTAATEGATISLRGLTSKQGVPGATFTNLSWRVEKRQGSAGPVEYATGAGTDFAFTPDDHGTYVVSFSAIDENGTLATAMDATFDVADANPQVTIDGVPTAVVSEGTAISLNARVILPGSADRIADEGGYQWSVTRNGAAFPITSAVNDQAFSFTPDDEGTYVVTVTVKDDDGLTQSASTPVLVGNTVPVFTTVRLPGLPGGPVDEGTAITFSARDTANALIVTDAAGDTLTFTWKVERREAGTFVAVPLSASAASGETFTFAAPDNGDYLVTLVADDGDGGSASLAGEFSVVNIAPTATLTHDRGSGSRVMLTQGESVTFKLVGDDAGQGDRESLTRWFALGDEEFVASTDGFSEPFRFTATGDYTLRWKVADKDGGETTGTATVSVANAAPTLSPLGEQQASSQAFASLAGANTRTLSSSSLRTSSFTSRSASPPTTITTTSGSIRLTGSFSDPGSSHETYRGTATILRTDVAGATPATIPLVVRPDNTFDAFYAFPAGGTYSVTATIYDSQGAASSPQTLNVQVIELTLSSTTLAENAGPNAVVGSLALSTPETGVTFSLVEGEGDADNALFDLVGGNLVARASFDYETASAYSVRVRAVGPTSGSTERSFVIRVTDAAEASAVIATSGMLSGVTTTYGEASGTTTITATGTNLTGGITATAPTGFEVSSDGTNFGPTATFTPASGSVNGTLSVRLAATTSAGSYSGTVRLESQGAEMVTVAIPTSTVTAPPPPVKVTGVYVRGSGWNASYLARSPFTTVSGAALGWQLPDGTAQLANASNVSWNNVDRISVRFDQPIAQPAADALQLVLGTAGGNQTIVPTAAPTLLAGGTVAQWTLPASFAKLVSGRYVISIASAGITNAAGTAALDGEWTSSGSTFAGGSGDGTAGGTFNFFFNALVGDVGGNGTTNTSDISAIRNKLKSALNTLLESDADYRLDLNGSNNLNSTDLSQLRTEMPTALGRTLASLPVVTAPVEQSARSTKSFASLADESGTVSQDSLSAEAWAWYALDESKPTKKSQPRR